MFRNGKPANGMVIIRKGEARCVGKGRRIIMSSVNKPCIDTAHVKDLAEIFKVDRNKK